MGTPPAALPGSLRGGRYEMVELLGGGGGTQNRVGRAHDRSLDRDVAIAVIEPSGQSTTQLARVSREARATGRLGNHESIVTIHDIGYERDQPCIVTEYMLGGDLAVMLEVLPDHRPPWPRGGDRRGRVPRPR
jgi:serine/threonine protein kinase